MSMDALPDRYADARGCLAELVDEQLDASSTRPFAALTWQELTDCGVAVPDQASVCKQLLAGFPASDACFVVRSRWQSG
jgi:hypothetical protein